MVFERTDPDENFDIARWVSTGGQWELGMWRVFYGARVRLGRVGAGGVVLDLCTGADPVLQNEILKWVLWITMPLSEDLTEQQMGQEFPCVSPRIKPINKDECYLQMKDLAWETIIAIADGSKQIVGGGDGGVAATNEVHGAEPPK